MQQLMNREETRTRSEDVGPVGKAISAISRVHQKWNQSLEMHKIANTSLAARESRRLSRGSTALSRERSYLKPSRSQTEKNSFKKSTDLSVGERSRFGNGEEPRPPTLLDNWSPARAGRFAVPLCLFDNARCPVPREASNEFCSETEIRVRNRVGFFHDVDARKTRTTAQRCQRFFLISPTAWLTESCPKNGRLIFSPGAASKRSNSMDRTD